MATTRYTSLTPLLVIGLALVVPTAGGATLTISPPVVPGGFSGFPYSVTFTASGGTAPYTFSLTSGSLPAGLTLSASGVLSGTSTTLGGGFYFEITAQDSAGNAGTRGYDTFFTGPPLTVMPASIPNGAVGQPYSVQFTATGRTGPFLFTGQGGGGGGDLYLDAQTGIFSGTPTLSGTFTLRVTANYSTSTGFRDYTYTIAGNNNLTLSPFTLPGGTVGLTYGQTVFASAGPSGLLTLPITWSTTGQLPPGISLAPAADRVTFQGNPTAAGTYSFQLTGRDLANRSAALSYSITIAAPTVTVGPPSLLNAFANVPYAVDFTASGGTPPYTFSVFGQAAGSVSAWLSAAGAFRFTPQGAGEWDFSIRATDANGAQGTRDYHLSIAGQTLDVSPLSVPTGTLGTPYSVQFSASGGTAPYTYLLGGALPSGLSLSGSGLLSGTPQQAGFWDVVAVTARDALGAVGSRSFQLRINGPPINLGPASLPDAVGGQPYSVQLTATGGVPPYSFTMPNANPWVAGLSLNASGLISGTPDSGNVILRPTIVATDALGSTGIRVYELRLKPSTPPVITFVGPSAFTVTAGNPISISITVNGAAFPVAYSAVGNLPPGLSLTNDNVNGVLQGTAPLPGTYSFTIQATDNFGTTASKTFSLTSSSSALSFAPVHLPPANEGQAYSVQFQGSGGAPPYTYSVAAGQMPTGITLSAAGLLSGTPAFQPTRFFTVTMRDSQNETYSSAMVFSVSALPISIGPASLPDATVGQSYAVQLTATNARAPFTFSLNSPPGEFAVSSSGLITGTPQGAAGPRTLTVRVVDVNGTVDSRLYTINVIGPAVPLSITTTALSSAVRGSSYNASILAAGGAPPYTFQVTQGAVAPGVTLSNFASAGVLSGIPTAEGSFSFTVTATDSQDQSVSRAFLLSVGSPPIVNSLSVDSSVLQFRINTGAARVTAQQCVAVRTSGQAVNVQGSLTGSPMWARLNATQLHTPGSLCVTADATSLPPGSYENLLNLQATGTQPPSLSIQLMLVVDAEAPATFVAPPQFNTSIGKDGPLRTESFILTNSGGQPGVFLINRTTNSWLNLWPLAGSINPGGSVVVTAQINPAGLASGVHETNFTITGGASPVTVRWTLNVASPPPGANTLFLDSSALQFSIAAGAQRISRSQCVAVLTSGQSAAVQGSLSGAPLWARLNQAQLQTPGSFCLTADATGLAPGSYTNTLNVQSAGTLPPSASVQLALVVEAATPAAFQAPSRMDTSAAKDGARQTGTFVLNNNGGEAATFQLTLPSAPWLQLSPSSGSLSGGGSVVITAQIDPTGLDSGVHEAGFTITGTDSPLPVKWILNVAPPAPALMALSQSALEFTAWQGGGSVDTSVGLVNPGAISLFPVIRSDASWLTVQPQSSVLAPGTSEALAVRADPAGLVPGYYSTVFTAHAPGAINGDQTVAVGLTVLPQSTRLPPDARVTGLAMTPFTPQGSIFITLPPGGALSFTSTIKSEDFGWLTLSPTQGTVPATGRLVINAAANIAGRAPGLYAALVTFGFSDGTVRSVPVELFIPNSPTQPRVAAQVCGSGSGVVAHMLSPEPGFAARAGRAVQLRVQAETCDGRPAGKLEVISRAGSQEIRLLPDGAGVWSGNWVPSAAGTATLRTSVTQASPEANAALEVQGQVSAAAGGAWIKAVTPAATQAANDPVVPGSWLTIYGESLALSEALASVTPLPIQLGGVRVLMGDVPLRLYYVSATQLNVLVPWSLQPGVSYQLVFEKDGQVGAVVQVAIAAVKPGLFTLNQQGTGQAAALLAGTSTVASPANPVSRGGILELYGTGFGAVDLEQSDGQPASSTQLVRTKTPVSVTIGGHAATVLFSGLAPGAVALYQINVLVPEEAPTGPAVEVIVSQQGVRSNTATVAVR